MPTRSTPVGRAQGDSTSAATASMSAPPGFPPPSTCASAASNSGVMTEVECSRKSDPYSFPRLGGRLSSEWAKGNNIFGRLVVRVIGPVDAKPWKEDEDGDHDRTHGRRRGQHRPYNTRNVRQRDRVNRRMVASVIRRLCLLRGVRECDLKTMIYQYNRKEERAAWKGGRGTARPSFSLAEAARSEW